MSTFAVFGMSRSRATQDARRSTPTLLDEKEWLKRVAAKVKEAMEGSNNLQLSDKFDAPQFAQQYLDLLAKTDETRSLHIKAYVRSEKPDPVTKKYTFSWREVVQHGSGEWKEVA